MPTIRETKKIVRACVREGVGVILLGSPGIAKSQIIESLAKEEKWGYTVHEGPSLDPTDVRGLMTLTADKERALFSISPIYPRQIDPNMPHLLVIEEITSALPSVQVALHSLFHPQERRLGEHKLPENVVPIAIGNFATDGAGARMLLNALKDRVMVLNVTLPYQEWREDYAIPNRVHPIVLGQLAFKPDMFNTFEKRDGKHSKDFVTPRTHTQISRWLYRAEKEGLSNDLIREGISAYGGEEIGFQYMAFKEYHDLLPNMDEIFAGKNFIAGEGKKKKEGSQDQGVMYAVCSTLVSRIGFKKDKYDERLEKAHMERVLEYAIFLKNSKSSVVAGAEWGELLFMDIRSRYIKDGVTDLAKLMKLLDSKLIDKFFDEFIQFAPKQ
jgi:hypothetical protein